MNGIHLTGSNRTGDAATTGAAPLPRPATRGQELRRLIEQRVVPHLVDRLGAQPPGGAFSLGTPEFSARLSVEMAVDAVGPHPERVGARLERLLEGGADPEELCLHVLAPAARHLGKLWVEDRLDFVDVTLGTMRLERSLHGLLPVSPPRRGHAARTPGILMMPLPGNQHTFGLSMASDFFRRAGWIVTDGAALPVGLEQHLRTHALDAVGLAVSGETQIDRLTETLRMIRAVSRNPRIRIALGGPLFLVQPGMATRFDADLVVTDGARAPDRLAAMLPDSPARPAPPGVAAGRSA